MSGPTHQLHKGTNPYLKMQRSACYNQSATLTVPAFGLVRVAGQQNSVLAVDQPNADGQEVWANGPSPILPQKYGVISKAWPLPVAYDNAATPARGDTWGAAAGTYLLSSGRPGFAIEADPNTTAKIVLARGVDVTSAWLQVTDVNPQTITLLVNGVASTLKGYPAKMVGWVSGSGSGPWSFFTFGGQNAWLLSPNSPDPNNPSTLAPHDQFPPGLIGTYALECVPVAKDQNGLPICVWPLTPGVTFETVYQATLTGAPNQIGVEAVLHLGRGLSMTGTVLLFGTAADDGSAGGLDLYVAPGTAAQGVGAAAQPYLCDTGTDGGGSQFVSGLNTAIGGGAVDDEGSDW